MNMNLCKIELNYDESLIRKALHQHYSTKLQYTDYNNQCLAAYSNCSEEMHQNKQKYYEHNIEPK